LIQSLDGIDIGDKEIIDLVAPKFFDAPTLKRPELGTHWEDILLAKPHHGVVKLCLLAKVDESSLCYAHQDFNELKTDDRVVIIVVLVDLFIVCSFKIVVYNATMKLFVCDACISDEIAEAFGVKVRRIATHNRCLMKYFFQVFKIVFDYVEYSIVSLFIFSADFPNFPVFLVML
jgi:hypothetical protein